MDQRARESYLEAQILTATPQKLRLMLIDAAIASARKTQGHWNASESEAAVGELIHCRNIVSELLSGIRPDDSELSKRVAAIYVFLFKALTEAQLRRDSERLGEVIRVLEVERETWRQICEQVPNALAPSETIQPGQGEITADDARALLPEDGPPPGGLLLDA